MAGLWSYSRSQVMLGYPDSQAGSRVIPTKVPLTLRRAKSIISTFIDKYNIVTQKTKSFGKPRETLDAVGPIPRHLEKAEAVDRFRLTTGHDFVTGSRVFSLTCPLGSLGPN
ncbi:uncharacterized protein TNCV_554611 [Trichonephila clavipes]|nr:uncharacterized protein TNCV_554611 [Trichonephila clavipes]